jgi:hypothetical protein
MPHAYTIYQGQSSRAHGIGVDVLRQYMTPHDPVLIVGIVPKTTVRGTVNSHG